MPKRAGGRRELVAFVLRPDRAGVRRIPLGPMDKVEQAVVDWRRAAGVDPPGDKPVPDENDCSARLRGLLWERSRRRSRGARPC